MIDNNKAPVGFQVISLTPNNTFKMIKSRLAGWTMEELLRGGGLAPVVMIHRPTVNNQLLDVLHNDGEEPGCVPSSDAGGGVGLGWVKASPGRLPTVRAAFPAGPDWAAVPGCPVTRPTGLLTAPRPRGGARGREMPPCLCVCALVCLRGGGGLWHTCLLHCCSALARGSVCLVLQAPAGRLESLTLSPPGEMWAWARNLHVTRTCYPTTPRLPIGTGRLWYVARLGSDSHSLTALGTGGAASRAGSGSHGRGRTLGRWRGTRAQSVLPCPGCHQCWLHWLRRYSPRRRGGPEGTTPEWPLR